ncbi:protein kinase [Streptomyces sp. NPDC056431]|uniref:serine/threonine-protein kinase n=1 Tax=Streptomyces sp. NPDC056431 TaxID=3345814 RepID=UPI003691C386
MALRDNDPRRIGGYELHDRLGAGGMGTVYLAQADSGRPVALKIVHEQFAADPEFRTRFRQEIRAARRVSGAFTAPVVAADPDAERPWMATAFVPGRTLRDRVESEGPLTGAELRLLAVGLVEALRELHQVRVIHRDLKPDNVLLTDDGPRVIDFGISRAPDHRTMTITGRILGTPPYMSPEQLSAPHRVTPATDVFSLGAVLCYATTGRGPFDGGSPYMTAYNVVHEPPEVAELSGTVREIVQWCLAKEPAERPGPDDLLTAFRTVPENEWGRRPAAPAAPSRQPAATTAPTDRSRAPRRPLLVALATAVALTVGTGAYMAWPEGGAGAGAGSGARTPSAPTRSAAEPDVPSAAALTAPTVYRPVAGGDGAAPHAYADAPERRPKGWRPWTAGADLGQCVFADASLVCLSATGGTGPRRVVRLDAATGRELWSVRAEVNGGESPAVVDGVVVVPAPRALKGLRLTDGSARWTLRTKEKPLHLTGDATRAYASLVDGTLLAVDARTGHRRWERSVPHALFGGSLLRVDAFAVHVVSAKDAAGADAFSGERVSSFAATDGRPLYTTRLTEPCDPVQFSVVMLKGPRGTFLCRISSPEGEEPGFLLNSPARGPDTGFGNRLANVSLRSLTVSDGHVFARADSQRPDDDFAEIDPELLGGPVWQLPLGMRCDTDDPAPVVTGQRAYVLCGARGAVVDLTRHTVASRFTLPPGSARAGGEAWNLLVAGGLVFVLTEQGWVSVDPYAAPL